MSSIHPVDGPFNSQLYEDKVNKKDVKTSAKDTGYAAAWERQPITFRLASCKGKRNTLNISIKTQETTSLSTVIPALSLLCYALSLLSHTQLYLLSLLRVYLLVYSVGRKVQP